MSAILDKISYWLAALMAAFGYMTWQGFTSVVGIVLGVCTFIISWYYKAREDKREQEKHKLQIESLRTKE